MNDSNPTRREQRRLGLNRSQVAAVVAGSAILLGSGGVALANAQDSGSAGTTQTTQVPDAGSSQGSGQGAAGLGSTDQGSTDQGSNEGRRGPGGEGGPGGEKMAAELATKLGLGEDEVAAALKTVHEKERTEHQQGAQGEKTPPTEAERAQRESEQAAALATALGVDQQKVTDALAEIRTEQQQKQQEELSTRLDEAVSAGTLTAADKASVLKAAQAGLIGGSHGGAGGPGGR